MKKKNKKLIFKIAKIISAPIYAFGILAGVFKFVPSIFKRLNQSKREKEHRKTIIILLTTIGVFFGAVVALWAVFLRAIKRLEVRIFNKEEFDIIPAEILEGIENTFKKCLRFNEDVPSDNVPVDTEATEDNLG